jgi:hypothetical protein
LGCLGTRQSPPGPGSDAEPQWDYHLDCGKGDRVRSIQLRSAEAKGGEEEHEEKAMAAQTRCTADILLRTTSGIPLGGTFGFNLSCDRMFSPHTSTFSTRIGRNQKREGPAEQGFSHGSSVSFSQKKVNFAPKAAIRDRTCKCRHWQVLFTTPFRVNVPSPANVDGFRVTLAAPEENAKPSIALQSGTCVDHFVTGVGQRESANFSSSSRGKAGRPALDWALDDACPWGKHFSGCLA